MYEFKIKFEKPRLLNRVAMGTSSFEYNDSNQNVSKYIPDKVAICGSRKYPYPPRMVNGNS